MHTIFISYRRDGGEIMAQMLYDRLTALGYSVFYDVVVLKGGRFNAKLLEAIEHATDFVVVLSPGALDRCVQDGDWVRQEIKHAFDHKKNIIPVLLRGFSFPTGLPADIAEIRNQNGVDFTNMGYFEARFLALVERLKTPVPVPIHSGVDVDQDYESFFQKEMKECQTVLHLIDEHWRQLVLETEDFAPITVSEEPERLSFILSMIDTWLEEKENFESRVNASLDIRETGYMQSAKVKLEHYYESVTSYQVRVKAFLELSEIEKELAGITAASEENFKKIETLRERVAELPDDISEQMSAEGKKKFSSFIKHLNTQIQFEREMSALEKKFSALPQAIRDGNYAFVHENAEIVGQDMEALDALVALCVSVCDTYNVNTDTPDEWILPGEYDTVLSALPLLKKLLEQGKIFLDMVELCKQIDALVAATSLERREFYTVVERFSGLSEEELSYVRDVSLTHYNDLHQTMRQTEDILEKATAVDALFAALPKDAQEGDIRYSYENYDAAYASTVALETWFEECKSFKTLFDEQRDKRFFSEDDMSLSQNQIYRAQCAKATFLFRSECLTAAHELEGALKEMLSGATFDPVEIFNAADRIDALETLCDVGDSSRGKRGRAKMLLSKEVFEKIVSYEEFLKIYYHVEDAFAIIFENTPLLLKVRQEVSDGAQRLKFLREKAEELLKGLAARREEYETVYLQDTDLVSYTEQALAFEAEAEKIAYYGALFDWAKDKESITSQDLKENAELRKETKCQLRAYGKVKHEAKKYDTEGDLHQAFAHVKKAYSRASWSIGTHRMIHVGFPIFTLLAFAILVLLPQMIDTELDFWKHFGLLCVTALLNVMSLRLVPIFKRRLIFLPVSLYSIYFFGYLLPQHLAQTNNAYWYMPYFMLVGVLMIILSASVRTSALYMLFTFLCRMMAVLSTIAIVALPFMALLEAEGLYAIDGLMAIDSVLNGFWNLLVCFVAGSFWLEIYAGSTLTIWNTTLLFGMIVRRACHAARGYVWKPKKEEQEEDAEEA